MMGYSRPLSLATAFLVSACAPLQQAPLLYSSKTTVGIDVSASTTESPGASISIGFKVVDAAYVPVAVSKEEKNPDGTPSHSFDIVKIEAVFGEGATSGRLDSLTEENKTRIREFLLAKQQEQLASEAVSKTEEAIKKLPDQIEKTKKNIIEKNDAITALPADAADNQKKATQSELATAQKESADLFTLQQTTTARLTSEKAEYEKAKTNAEKLFVAAAQAASLLRTDKRDAMSVYGRFNADSSASASSSPSANLTAGKIFSTGVASQNLTEAAKIEAQFANISHCIDNVLAIAQKIGDSTKRDDLLAKVDKLCGSAATAAASAASK